MTPVQSRTVVDETRDLRPEFAPYLRFMAFLADVLGPRAEIVLHDLSDLSRSIVAVTNGHISGRDVGGPATDLVLKVQQNRAHSNDDYLANYAAESTSGGRFRSSTYFIRDTAGEVVGMLCVNVDDEPLLKAWELLGTITATTTTRQEPPSRGAIAERLSVSADELTLDGINRVVQSQGVPAHRMNTDEKLQILRELDRAGVFLLKGAVSRAAETLHVSEPTLYRYLKQVRS
ncbi:transcriptional regulator [Actinoplanes sp. TFC3]|uniref:helix-turn-helix transcriptional regulator n=1 Tax=Actinoplanes sp. TFC3 TaxID=1710355 RepID=UPI0009EA0643|nr:PAS domain-containing protein [Actinoplanes sp. TFC3]